MALVPILLAGFLPTSFAGQLFTSDVSAPWECHHYVGDQEETLWCATADFDGGFEYQYAEGGLGGPCAPCWCCKRAAIAVAPTGSADATPEPTTTTAAVTPWQPEATEAPWQPEATEAPWLPEPTEAPWQPPTEAPWQPETTTTTLATTTTVTVVNYTKHAVDIGGLTPAFLAGAGGGVSVKGDELRIGYESGLTLFSEFSGDWEPEGMTQLKLLGKSMSFTVDLANVGCACNLAFYLIAAPARDWNGKAHAGGHRDGQPPYYCDANKVGGQWCPEVDIMEANTHAFQSTPHKCDAPSNGHYGSCDRGGCGQNTRETPTSYGPGSAYVIDTRSPFEVRTEFPEDDGILMGMRTMLRQGRREVVLNHSNCEMQYFARLSDAVASGMSLRITYWGDSAETMAWLDSPPCGGSQSCTASAGVGVIRNMSIETLPKWRVSDRSDELNGRVIPQAVVQDPALFRAVDNRGIADWGHSLHYVHLGAPKEAKDKGYLQMVAKKFADVPIGSRVHWWFTAGAFPIPAVALLILSSSIAALIGVRLLGQAWRALPAAAAAASGGVSAASAGIARADRSAALSTGRPSLVRCGTSSQQLLDMLGGSTV